ncbi:MAG: hypothetical protein ABH839_03695 [Chloroflexota bacterium]
MKIYIFIAVILGLIIGFGGGYATGYYTYVPQIESHRIAVNEYVQYSSKLEETISSQDKKISELEYDKSLLQAGLGQMESKYEELNKDISDANDMLQDLQSRINKITAITIPQNYQWDYNSTSWTWELPIPLLAYVESLERPRPSFADYVDMAKDPNDDSYIDQMVANINQAALMKGYTDTKKLNFLVAFVQSLPYTVDIETKPYDEYPRYPIETLFDRGGDCEDTSILAAALLDRMGYDVALLHLQAANHIAVGVSLDYPAGMRYEYNGKEYYFLETTGAGWEIGQIPPDFGDAIAFVYPLRK